VPINSVLVPISLIKLPLDLEPFLALKLLDLKKTFLATVPKDPLITAIVQSTAFPTSLNGVIALVLPSNKTDPTSFTRMLLLVVSTVPMPETTPLKTKLVTQFARLIVKEVGFLDFVTVLPALRH